MHPAKSLSLYQVTKRAVLISSISLGNSNIYLLLKYSSKTLNPYTKCYFPTFIN